MHVAGRSGLGRKQQAPHVPVFHGGRSEFSPDGRAHFRAYGPHTDEIIAIAHSDCEEDAQYLAGLLRKKRSVQDILIRCYEPGTGSHVGPGAVALFFFSPVPCK